MRTAAALVLMLALGGCMSAPKAGCPVGQSQLHTAQVFLGAKAPTKVNDRDLRRFVDKEVTPRFPDGVTVVEGGGQWKGADNRLMREAAKMVLIVLPTGGDGHARVEAVRAAYRVQFKQDPVVVVPPPACVAL